MGKKLRPTELARYLIWSGKLCDRANVRWRAVRPKHAPWTLIGRAQLNTGLHAALAEIDSPTVDSHQAGRLVASIFAERPKDVQREARQYLAHCYRLAIERESEDEPDR